MGHFRCSGVHPSVLFQGARAADVFQWLWGGVLQGLGRWGRPPTDMTLMSTTDTILCTTTYGEICYVVCVAYNGRRQPWLAGKVASKQ